MGKLLKRLGALALAGLMLALSACGDNSPSAPGGDAPGGEPRRTERPVAWRRGLRYFPCGPSYGSLASSSTILRGRSGQCLQHFMSTEYIRAMQ